MCVCVWEFLCVQVCFSKSKFFRLQKSEQDRSQSDQLDKDMRVELEGKVNALEKQLADLDTLR